MPRADLTLPFRARVVKHAASSPKIAAPTLKKRIGALQALLTYACGQRWIASNAGSGILNKGESRHALARAVFLRQLGELRNRVAETMAYRASGLNLVVNAIILWNTVYLSRAVRFVHDQGNTIPDALLAQVAPLPWSHIALTGDYLRNETDRPLERYRPIRANRFNPKNFLFP